MVLIHRGLGLAASLARASSSSRPMLVAAAAAAQRAPARHSRLYASDSKGAKNEYEDLLGALSGKEPSSTSAPADDGFVGAKLDLDSNPFALRPKDQADVNAIADILSSRGSYAPSSRPLSPPPWQTQTPTRAGRAGAPTPAPAPIAPAEPAPPVFELPMRAGQRNPPTSRFAPSHIYSSEENAVRAGLVFDNRIASVRVNYKLYVVARLRNCILTLVDEDAHLRASVSAGMCGFRNAAEGSYEAGYQCAVRMFDCVRAEVERRDKEVVLEILLDGFGQGRLALLKALAMSEGDGVREIVDRLTDKTPIKIGGVRLQKKRRL